MRGAVALLEENGVDYEFRDYVRSPLSTAEIRELLVKLNMSARDLLRRSDSAYRENELDGSETDATLLPLMSAHPGLLQRPIAVRGRKAIVARPPEKVLEI